MDKEAKREMVQTEFAELKRVGNVPFAGYLPAHLVGFDLSVLGKQPAEETKPKLRMKYVPIVRVDFDRIHPNKPSYEVRARYGENHVPLNNQGRFGSAQ